MRILYIETQNQFSGIGRYTEDYHKLLPDCSNIIQFVFRKRYINTSVDVQKFYATKSNILNLTLGKVLFKNIINKINTSGQIIHITSHVFPPTVKFNKKLSILTVHDLIAFKFRDNYSRFLTSYYKYAINKNMKHYTNILTVSNHVKKEILERYNVKDKYISVIPPVISDYFYHVPDKAELRKKLNLPLDKKLILSVSTMEKRKNTGMIQKVMEKINGDFNLVRVGEVIGNSITFKNVDKITINEIYNACDMLYFPTLEEGFGIPLVEAMRVGIPIVSSNIPVVKEVVGDAGKLVDPNDVDENIEAIYHVAENPNYYILKGYERSKLYSGETVKEKLYKYYSTISCN
jgi:glycosyltransferase involved in cell wall biosynthesis